MKKRRLLALPLIGLAMLGVVSCGDKTESSGIIEPNSDSLASITLDSNKMKTTYYEGQKLDLTGLVVKANYENGNSKEVTNYTWDESTFDANNISISIV